MARKKENIVPVLIRIKAEDLKALKTYYPRTVFSRAMRIILANHVRYLEMRAQEKLANDATRTAFSEGPIVPDFRGLGLDLREAEGAAEAIRGAGSGESFETEDSAEDES